MLTSEQQNRIIAVWIAHANDLQTPHGAAVPLFYAGHTCGAAGLCIRYFILLRKLSSPYQTFFVDWQAIRDDAALYGLFDIVEALS